MIERGDGVLTLELRDRDDAAQASIARLPYFAHGTCAKRREAFLRTERIAGG